MLRLKIRRIRQGQHPSEVVIALPVAVDGDVEELMIVDERSIKDDTLGIGYPVGADKQRLLVELPRETLRGSWRVWVSKDEVVKEAAHA